MGVKDRSREGGSEMTSTGFATSERNLPPSMCAICGKQIIGDNFSESTGMLTHIECPSQEEIE